jgi:hypothetical protein
MIGIYKITSPNGRVYIGQSIDIEKRFKQYQNLNRTKVHKKLYRSFLKYGIINHNFSIEIECLKQDLNKMERHCQEFYDSVKQGLNCFYTSTDEKIRINSDEYNLQISQTLKSKYKSGEIINYRKGKGKKINIFNYKGDILYENVDIEESVKLLNLSNRSVLNDTLRKNKFLSQKQYIIIPIENNYKDYIFNYIKKYNGEYLPIYQIFDNGHIKKCTISSKYRIINKLLNSENYIYYSKKNKSYYTFIGLINAVLDRNILDN